MFVKTIKSFDEASREADVYVSDGVYELLCFVHPVGAIQICQNVISVSALFCSEPYRAEKEQFTLQKQTGYYASAVTGKVLSRGENLVCVGEIRIKLDTPLPKDIANGEYVFFTADRFDAELE